MVYLIVVVLVSLSAIFSGLTLGFFSLNRNDLERKAKLGDKDAKEILSVRRSGNLLLSTLLIGNVTVNTTLSIFLGSIVPGFIAGLIATFLIVVLGEIIPQAVFARHAKKWAPKLVWIVKIFRFIFYPVCKPLAFILDKALGEEIPMVYTKHELIEIIEEHEESEKSDVENDEKKIIRGALMYGNKKVRDILTPRIQVFSLDFDQEFDDETIREIRSSGRSRIPVYKETDNLSEEFVAVLYMKDLVGKDLRGKTAGELARKDVIFVDSQKPLDELLEAFKKTRHHLFIVLNEYGDMSGIVTIEDVLEEIIGEEIVDEFDKVEDTQEEARKRMREKKINRV